MYQERVGRAQSKTIDGRCFKIPNFCQIIVGQQTLVVALCDAKKAKSKCSRIRSFGYDPWVPINTCNFITIYHIIRREQARPQMGGVSKFPKDRIRERLLFAFFAPHSATTKFQCPTIIWQKLYRAIFFSINYLFLFISLIIQGCPDRFMPSITTKP